MLLSDAVVSGLAAATIAIALTILVERLGGQIGGVIGTVPSTMVPAAIGLWAVSHNPSDYARAMSPVPFGMLINAIFLLVWRVVPAKLSGFPSKWLVPLTTAISLVIWVFGALVVVEFFENVDQRGVPPLVVGWFGFLILVAFGLSVTAKGVPEVRATTVPSIPILFSRGILAGTAIGAAVILGHSGHSLVAGIAAVFPAIFLTTMVALWWSHGYDLPASATGPMALGASSVALFSLLTASLYWRLDVLMGTVASWLVAVVVCTGGSAYWLSTRRTLIQSEVP